MIPEFPKFKLLELSDYQDIQKMISQFPPYSDFNFISMWVWNINNEITISLLHNNLVLCFTDYITGKPFYMFLGANKANETAKDLIDLSIKNDLPPILRLIPEVSVQNINRDMFEVLEDRDNFDYIYNIEELRDLRGGKFSSKRNDFNSFVTKFPKAEARVISLTDPRIVQGILKLAEKWSNIKSEKGEVASHDIVAIQRLLDSAHMLDLVTIGVFMDDTLVAFFVNELLHAEFVLAHLMKADMSIDRGLYAFLIKKSAEILSTFHKKFINYEQDLGIESLRIAKSRLNPVSFLKKYTIRYSKN